MNTSLQARILDMHTLLLGKNGHWIRLSLPWLARDITTLLEQLQSNTADLEEDTLHRLPALRLVLMQLEATEEEKDSGTDVNTPTAQPKQSNNYTLQCADYHDQAKRIDSHDPIPADGDIYYVCDPIALLEFEALFSHRHPRALLSFIIYSDQAIVIAPILPSEDYCALCFSYLMAMHFGLPQTNQKQEKIMLETAFALARSTKRQHNETLFFDGKTLEVKPFIPFIGCPQCLSSC